MEAIQFQFENREEFDILNQRGHGRYKILDKRIWNLKIQNKKIPIDWIHDMSTTGMQIRYGSYNCYQVGDKIDIIMSFMGTSLFATTARVKWSIPDTEHINMFVLGLEFLDPTQKISRTWMHRKLTNFLEKADDFVRRNLKAKQEESRRRRLKFSDAEIALSIVIPFVAGYASSFFLQ